MGNPFTVFYSRRTGKVCGTRFEGVLFWSSADDDAVAIPEKLMIHIAATIGKSNPFMISP